MRWADHIRRFVCTSLPLSATLSLNTRLFVRVRPCSNFNEAALPLFAYHSDARGYLIDNCRHISSIFVEIQNFRLPLRGFHPRPKGGRGCRPYVLYGLLRDLPGRHDRRWDSGSDAARLERSLCRSSSSESRCPLSRHLRTRWISYYGRPTRENYNS